MRNWFVIVLILASISRGASAGIEFFKGSWEEALAEASRQDKLIFIDAYTVWCGPCKYMAANIFPDERVGQFFNQHFISVKLDMEKDESASFRAKHRVTAYPTFFFINGNDEEVHTMRGAMQADQLIQQGQQAIAKMDPIETYAAAYEAGDRSATLVYKYTRAMIRNGQPHLRVANEYVRSQQNLNTPDNLRYLLLTATEMDSRLFELLIEHKKQAVALVGQDAFNAQVLTACKNTAAKAREFKDHELLAKTWESMKAHYPAKAAAFEIETEMDYCAEHNDPAGYTKAAQAYARTIQDDPVALLKLAERTVGRFSGDDRSMALAEEAAQKATVRGEGYRYFYTYASILNQRGKKEEALAAANRALEISKQSNDAIAMRTVQVLIRNIQGQ